MTRLESLGKTRSGQNQSPIKSPPKKVRRRMPGHGKAFQERLEEVLAADGKESSGTILSDAIEMEMEFTDDGNSWSSAGEGGGEEISL
jgi:hypothetical protein